MPVITRPHHFNVDDLYVDLTAVAGQPIHLKCEGFNFAGSIKIKAAVEMVTAALGDNPGSTGITLVESSSGNLGVALSVVAASHGVRFVCVTDSRCTRSSLQLMRALGTEVLVVDAPHAETGLLGARLELVERLCAENRNFVWLNQYANEENWRAHYRTTGPQILRDFPDLDVLFVGSGTTGTLMGCARYLKQHRPSVRIVAIDAAGSTTFGGSAMPRFIPGLGTAVTPPLLETSYVDDVVWVSEPDTVRMCRMLLRSGYLFGGSTGTVVSGALQWLRENAPSVPLTAVAIAPDLGDRYLDTVYDDDWVQKVYGAAGPFDPAGVLPSPSDLLHDARRK